MSNVTRPTPVGTGGKGNIGKFIERDPLICAAGVPSSQPDQNLAQCFQQYSLQDEVDALVQDAIVPPPPPAKLPPLRRPRRMDMRNVGTETDVAALINPPQKTKFQYLVEDFKNTAYTSYWKTRDGRVPDPTPMFPDGFDIDNHTYGKKNPAQPRLYDVIMPPDSTERIRPELMPSYVTNRKYCKPAYDPMRLNGMKTNQDPRGALMKCCLTDKNVELGASLAKPISSVQAEFIDVTRPKLGSSLVTADLSFLPKGYAFGKVEQSGKKSVPNCLTSCDICSYKQFLRKCLGHLNTVRGCLSKLHEPPFFAKLYREIKYYDKSKSGWLPKDIIYDICTSKQVRFNPTLIEPLLSIWNAFDGSQINYEIFIKILNFRIPSSEFPKISDIPKECLDYRTTYSDMVKPGQEADKRLRAGLPSGRYFDLDYPITPELCVKAHRADLPQETNVRSCLCPSIFTQLGVSHRDMYAVRDPQTIRKVFEASGETFDEEKFAKAWNKAKEYHSQGLVCYETFRKALNETK